TTFWCRVSRRFSRHVLCSLLLLWVFVCEGLSPSPTPYSAFPTAVPTQLLVSLRLPPPRVWWKAYLLVPDSVVLRFSRRIPSSEKSPFTDNSQNVLPDKSLAPPLLDAGKRLLKFLQQRFGLYLSGSHAGDGEDNGIRGRSGGASAAASISSRSLSGGEDGQSSFADPAAFSEGAMEAVDAGDSNQAGGVEGLSLMQLELSEEDQPAVVPYDEVMRALGGDALGLNQNQHEHQHQPEEREQQQQQQHAPKSLTPTSNPA
ncbi:unnamed protein product, partial [Ectocarpus sp. 12 AP-2014]